MAPVAVVGLGAAGCRVNEDDLSRWEATQRGPEKLKAVLLHDKYALALRTDAAVSLIKMKPRGGRFVGIDIMVEALADIPTDQREKILAGLVPAVVAELQKEPPAAQAGQPPPPDPSFAYKDAAYAVLTYEKPVLLTDEKLRSELRESLIVWAMKDFEHRLENRNQKTGMEQLLRLLGSDGVKGLPDKITRDSRALDKIGSLIDELSSPATREAASARYVEIAKWITSPEWYEAKKQVVEASNKTQKLEPTPEQFQQQMDQYQDEELMRVLGNLKKVGGRAAVDFCLTYAADGKAKKERRAFALAAIELKLDPKNADDVNRIFAIAMSDSPPEVLDQAFKRVGEMPREAVIDKLYQTFKTDKWKVRRSAAAIVLKMSEVKHVDEFMSKLPEKEAKGFARGEALMYGAALVDLKNGDVKKAVDKYLTEPVNLAPRATAFSFYLMNGKGDDLKTVAAFENDKVAMPVCDADDDCKWTCYVPKDEKKPEDTELKEIKTFGDYVKLCVEPAIKGRK